MSRSTLRPERRGKAWACSPIAMPIAKSRLILRMVDGGLIELLGSKVRRPMSKRYAASGRTQESPGEAGVFRNSTGACSRWDGRDLRRLLELLGQPYPRFPPLARFLKPPLLLGAL